MKKSVLISLLMACLPFLVMAQSNDDLYFIPKKKTEKKVTSGIPAKVVIEKEKKPTTVYAAPGSTVVVKDVKGNVRDVDEYNRRYTSRDNTFSMENDTLYIEEKPYNERGEWVNGFEGSQSDYEYAMRIIRFRNPRYAIPVSSPLYWDVVYALPSWEWNVFDDGYYAYVFPTYTNRLWWDWRFDYSWGWGWRSPWYYNSWYYGGWYPHHHHHWHVGHHHHHYPHYAWGGVGGYWGGGHGWNGSSARNPGIHAGRYTHNYGHNYGTSGSSSRRVVTAGNRNSRDNYVNGVRQSNNRNDGTVRSSGRVVTAKDGSSSVRPQRSAVRGRDNSSYTRPTQGKSSSYTRQSSTRSTVNNTGSSSSYQRKSGAAERGAYRSNGSSSSRSSNNSRSSYSSGSSRSSSSRGSSYSSGSSSSSRSSFSGGGGGGGGSHSSGGGGGSRSGGGGRR